jgi:hypothetical protein
LSAGHVASPQRTSPRRDHGREGGLRGGYWS